MKYLCLHGHFYQPPRENPWLERIERQDSAAPFADWNERITAECYGPNAWARRLDGERRIADIANNYSRISFNFGPTLLSWLERHEPDVYAAVLQADRESCQRFSGHGSAIAQVYNHMILPLANRRDKITQIEWGLTDFRQRFGRDPEGLWLAETAVDSESLDLMAERGIRFTILAPSQAHRIRRIGHPHWHDVSGGHVDPTRPYQVRLPSGRTIAVFFYDGPISQGIAFENLLNSGERLLNRLESAFSDDRHWAQLVHISTDGETYGHHHRHGEMALAYALDLVEQRDWIQLTNYGEFLAKHPPQLEAQIWENSSWSCVHGVERWRSDCGCNSGMRPGWHQQWRGPYRMALDELRDTLATHFEDICGTLLHDPWRARDGYISVLLDDSEQSRSDFLARHAHQPLSEPQRTTIWKLLEMQRNCMLMYTSCGWFFDELSGLETVQTMCYARRALELGEEVFGLPLERQFLDSLQRAPSNLPQFEHGRAIYEQIVIPQTVTPDEVAREFVALQAFGISANPEFPGFEFEAIGWENWLDLETQCRRGRLTIRSRSTRESFQWECCSIRNLTGDVQVGLVRLNERLDQDGESTSVADLNGLPLPPGQSSRSETDYEWTSFSQLGSWTRQLILDAVLEETLERMHPVYERLLNAQQPLLRLMAKDHLAVPPSFHHVQETCLLRSLKLELSRTPLNLEGVHQVVEQIEAARVRVPVDRTAAVLTIAIGRQLETLRTVEVHQRQLRMPRRPASAIQELHEAPVARICENLMGLVRAAAVLGVSIDLSQVQNEWHRIAGLVMANLSQGDQTGPIRQRVDADDLMRPDQIDARAFLDLGERLGMRVSRPLSHWSLVPKERDTSRVA